MNPVTKTNWEGTGVTPELLTDEKLAFQAAMREIVASNPAKYAGLKSQVEAESAVDPFVEANLMKYRETQQPGGEALVRKLFEGMSSGNPDYAIMTEEQAKAIRGSLTMLQADMSKAGAVTGVKFTGVGPQGLDNYELTTATSVVRFGVYLEDGKIVAMGFGPPQPLPPQR